MENEKQPIASELPWVQDGLSITNHHQNIARFDYNMSNNEVNRLNCALAVKAVNCHENFIKTIELVLKYDYSQEDIHELLQGALDKAK